MFSDNAYSKKIEARPSKERIKSGKKTKIHKLAIVVTSRYSTYAGQLLLFQALLITQGKVTYHQLSNLYTIKEGVYDISHSSLYPERINFDPVSIFGNSNQIKTSLVHYILSASVFLNNKR